MEKKPLAYIVEDNEDTVIIFRGALELAEYDV